MTPTASWPSEWSSVPFWRFLNSVHIGATRILTTTRSPLAFGMLWSTTSTLPLPVISAVLTFPLSVWVGGVPRARRPPRVVWRRRLRRLLNSRGGRRRASALDRALEQTAHELLPEDQVHDQRKRGREGQHRHLGRELNGRASGELQHPD